MLNELSNIVRGLPKPRLARFSLGPETTVADLLAFQTFCVEDNTRTEAVPVHVSSFAEDFCIRATHFAGTTELPNDKVIKPSDQIIWLMGRASEEFNRHQVIQSIGSENVYGEWRCLCGNLRMTGWGNAYQAPSCRKCDTFPNHIYREKRLQYTGPSGNIIIQGSPDLILRDAQGKIRVIEFKTIEEKAYADTVVAKPNHIFQVYSYWRILKEQGVTGFYLNENDILGSCEIVYTSKKYAFSNYGGKNYKAFSYNFDTDAPVWTVQMFDTGAGIVDDYISSGKAMPQRVPECTSFGSKRASTCPFSTLCFQCEG